MPVPPVPITSLLERASGEGTRSTILRPLSWLLGLCSVAAIVGASYGAPTWLTWLFGIAAGVTILLFLVTYIYCLWSGKTDLLRTEKYSLTKLAIERGFVGDSKTGIIELKDDDDDLPMLGSGQGKQ